jgi:hypothetical protein
MEQGMNISQQSQQRLQKKKEIGASVVQGLRIEASTT